jgi:putative hydrolase of the HAD superfamily
MIELYIFDMGGVLVRNFDIGPEAARRLGIDVGDFRAFMEPDLMPFMRGDIDGAEFWRRFGARSGLGISEDYWTTLFRPRLDGPTVDLVHELAAGALAEGSRVVCGTNTIEEHYAIHKAQGQYGGFHAVYASHFMGTAKPEPGFWLDILEAEGVRPERAFFVDDFPENVEAARALGIESRLYVSADVLRADLLALGSPLGPGAPRAVAAPGGGRRAGEPSRAG